jgi:hypothetical protein
LVGILGNAEQRQPTVAFEFRGRKSGVNRRGLFQPSGSLQQAFQPLGDGLKDWRVW